MYIPDYSHSLDIGYTLTIRAAAFWASRNDYAKNRIDFIVLDSDSPDYVIGRRYGGCVLNMQPITDPNDILKGIL